jgi:hypothetical protein
LRDNIQNKSRPDSKRILQTFVLITIVTLLVLVTLIISIVERKLYISPKFYIMIFFCLAWWGVICSTIILLRKYNQRLARVLGTAEILIGLFGSLVVGDILLNQGNLFMGVYAIIILLFAFFALLREVLRCRGKDNL